MMTLPNDLTTLQKLSLLNHFESLPNNIRFQIRLEASNWVKEISSNMLKRPIRISMFCSIRNSLNFKREYTIVSSTLSDIQKEYLLIIDKVNDIFIGDRASLYKKNVDKTRWEELSRAVHSLLTMDCYDKETLQVLFDTICKIFMRYADIIDNDLYHILIDDILLYKAEAVELMYEITSGLESGEPITSHYYTMLLRWINDLIDQHNQAFDMDRFSDICTLSYIFLRDMDQDIAHKKIDGIRLISRRFKNQRMLETFIKTLEGYATNPSDFMIHIKDIHKDYPIEKYHVDPSYFIDQQVKKSMKFIKGETNHSSSIELHNNLIFSEFYMDEDSLNDLIRNIDMIGTSFIEYECDPLPEELKDKKITFDIPEQDLLYLHDIPSIKTGVFYSKYGFRHLIQYNGKVYILFTQLGYDTGTIYGISVFGDPIHPDTHWIVTIKKGKIPYQYDIQVGSEVYQRWLKLHRKKERKWKT